jgi:hypothetical protein
VTTAAFPAKAGPTHIISLSVRQHAVTALLLTARRPTRILRRLKIADTSRAMFQDDKKDPFWGNSLFAGTKLPNGGASWAAWTPPPEPERIQTPIPERWPAPRERTDKVFAKSCAAGNWCSTEAGTEVEPASNFGAIMMAGAMLMPSASEAIATALGADMGLGRMAGGGIMQRGHTWLLRGAGGPASLFVLGCSRLRWATVRSTPMMNCAA